MVKFISAFFVAAVAQEQEPVAVNILRPVDPEVGKDVNFVDGPQRGLFTPLVAPAGALHHQEQGETPREPEPLPDALAGWATTANIDALNEIIARLERMRTMRLQQTISDPSIKKNLDLKDHR
jgi:hypothetical protein